MMTVLFCLLIEGEEYWKFKTGTKWEYTEKQGEVKIISQVQAKEMKDDKLVLESKREVPEQDAEEKTMYTYAKDGYIVWAEEGEDGAIREYLRIWKIGSKKGDTWTSTMGESELTLTFLGIEEVKVEAGTYKDARRVGFEMKDEEKGQTLTGEYWLVPNVGLVKMQMKQMDQTVYELELISHTPCK